MANCIPRAEIAHHLVGECVKALRISKRSKITPRCDPTPESLMRSAVRFVPPKKRGQFARETLAMLATQHGLSKSHLLRVKLVLWAELARDMCSINVARRKAAADMLRGVDLSGQDARDFQAVLRNVFMSFDLNQFVVAGLEFLRFTPANYNPPALQLVAYELERRCPCVLSTVQRV